MDEEAIEYLAFSMLIVFLVIAASSSFGGGIFSILASIIALVTAGIILILNFADYLIFPAVTKALNMEFYPARNYKIVKTQDAILKNISGLYYATGFIAMNLFPYSFKEENMPSQEEDQQKLLTAPESWEKSIINLTFPFKFHVFACGLSVQNIRDELEGKRSFQEFEMSKAQKADKPDPLALTEIQRKINVIKARIDRISQGERPVATIMYIETTAVGVSEKSAMDNLTEQIKELQLGFSYLDLELQRVIGRELYVLFQFNFSLPISFEETAQYFDQQQ
ncbi:MAG: hypothetical protein M1168_00370 [Candidatus Marsarchaeota archaeon]|nr:hypothetical protein [Candidatus Marsarchaeota archaeon]MCL5094426.1 hypothetical protein [Candidatus Marsarchaeota archaeon]